MAPLRLRIEGSKFRDAKGREVTLRGINVAADAKFPYKPDQPSHVSKDFFDGDNVSFVGRPFPTEDARFHFRRLRKWGYNTLRYVFTWEAIEHEGPGKYDEEWIAHTISILRMAKSYGFYIFLDPHQDVWSRFSGGSGAPMWTLYACGLNPKTFAATEAALVQNTFPEAEKFPKMIWATNYTRMVCQVVFTLFFGGKEFAPKAIIDGKNIQDYLQGHFLAAIKHFAQRIHEAGDIENEVVIGWESLNEPNRGLIGWQDLSVVPSHQKLQKGTSPTAWQAILTGSGRACEIETWDFGGLGPYKSGSALVDPEGETAWLPSDYDDTYYGWKRDPGWKLGKCLWAQCGVWDPSSDTLLKKDYFAKHPASGHVIDYKYFTDTFFMDFYRQYSTTVRTYQKDAILFCQPPVLEVPPSIKGTSDDDPNMVFAPHFYDGVTLMTKKWNKVWNVDVFGVLRGKYLSPAFAIKIGETAIRNCFKEQLTAIRNEGIEYMGSRPCIFTEIGIPYDMDEKHAYKTGDYSSQIAAMDANHFALEGSAANGFTLWVYVASNTHYWGDQWNGEDLSIVSLDDNPLPTTPPPSESTLSLTKTLTQTSTTTQPPSLKQTMTAETRTSSGMPIPKDNPEVLGFRAGEAYVRPSPRAVHGNIQTHAFDLKNATFTLNLVAPSSTPEAAPTEIYLPRWHFPTLTEKDVDVSGGKWQLSDEGVDAEDAETVQVLKWWHAEGEQRIVIRGVRRKIGGKVVGEGEGEDGYLRTIGENCAVM